MTLTACEGDAASHTVGSLLYEQASARPDKDLLVVDDARLSFAEAERRSALLARALLAAGAGWGTRVGILYPNGPEFVVSWLAAARIGAVSDPSVRSQLAPNSSRCCAESMHRSSSPPRPIGHMTMSTT